MIYAGLRHAEDFPQNYVDEACKEIQLLATPRGVYQEYGEWRCDGSCRSRESGPPAMPAPASAAPE